MGAHLPREHDLFQVACPDALHGALDGVLVVRGRGGARHAGALDGVGVEEGHRGGCERADADEQPLGHRLGVVVGMDDSIEGHAGLVGLPAER